MAFTTSGITDIRVSEYDGGLFVRARNTHPDKVVQCYLAGELVDYQHAVEEAVEFRLAGVGATDGIRLLAVDEGEGGTDYFQEAFGHTYGNRIRLRTPQKIVPYLPTDKWKLYRGDAGQASADIRIWEQDFYPGGRRCGGFGFHFGHGGFGWDGYDGKGFGYNFGYGEFGFDCEMLEWVTETLPPGTYPYKAMVVDAAGNESAAAGGAIELDTYARPALGLTIQSYNPATDALQMSFTASEDL
ncbi:MAG: hypothetical protein AMJ81_09290 [Phycisphaerae bacterium SM23_33]|nr:MAG: hypothetical protein AMJ81_09290 [Phycisphaerae bacterium SM23_33]